MILEGLEVLLLQPDFATAPKIVGNYKSEQVDLGEAPRIDAYLGDRPLHGFTHRFKLSSRTAAAILEDFFFDRAGKWQPFWLPSWHGELNPVATIADGGSSLSISPVNYATVYDPTHANPARLGHYIFLIHYDGTFLVRKVTAVSGTSPEVLTLDAPVTREFALGEFAVGFVYCVTSVGDKFAFTFNGKENASLDLAVTEEPFFDPEAADAEEPTFNELLEADFAMDVSAGDPPLEVAFTDTSAGTPTAWLWNFGDGSATETTQNTTHEFTDSGRFNVRLTVTDASGLQSSITKVVTVNAEAVTPDPALASSFTATPESGNAPLEVVFADTSTGTPNGWLWSFGDGITSAEQNPTHIYGYARTYTVTLRVRDVTGAESTSTKQIEVTEGFQTVSSCDSGADYDMYPGYGLLSCSSCCAGLDAMAIGDLVVWSEAALVACLSLTVYGGIFEYDSKTFGMAPNEPFNNGGSYNINGAYFYDVVRIS